MDTKKLRQKILDLAIHGKLVPQDPNDEPASVLLERIREEKERLIKEGKIKKSKKSATSDTPPYENVPEGWCVCNLSELALIGTGSTPSKSNKQYWDGEYAWISSSATSQPFIDEPTTYITEQAILETNCQEYPVGTIIMAMYGEGKTRGQVSELRIKSCTNQACAAIIPIIEDTKEYIKLYLQSQYYRLRSLAEGGLQPNLNLGKISDYEILLPCLSEQKRIVNCVKQCIDIVESLETDETDLVDLIQRSKAAILNLAMSGRLVLQDASDEPASDLLARLGISSDNRPYENLPEGWDVCTLDDITEYEQPQNYIVSSTNYADFYDTPVLTAGKSFIIGYTNDKEGIFTNIPVIIFDDFTTESKYVDFPFKVKSSAMKILKVKDGIDIKYVTYFMSITRLVGQTHKRYWISEYSKLQIPIPPISEQKRIVSKIEELFSQLDFIANTLE